MNSELFSRKTHVKTSIVNSILNGGNRYFVGIDIGGTKTQVVLTDHNLKELGTVVHPTIADSSEILVENTVETVKELVFQVGIQMDQIIAYGIGVPGLVDPVNGLVRMAVNLNLVRFPLGEVLLKYLGAPVRLENDVRLAALGAYHLSSRNESTLAYFNVGTGIAAGLVIDGQLYRGVNGMAGEIGHVIIQPDGPLCRCGMNGCLETLVAGPSIARLAKEAIASGETTLLTKYRPLTSKEVYEAADLKDPFAERLVNQVGEYIGRALHMLVMAYDVQCVILGGGVTKAGDIFLAPIINAWTRLHPHSLLARTLLRPEMLRLAPSDKNLVALGGVGLAAYSKPVQA